MTLTQLAIFGAIGLGYAAIVPGRMRGWLLMAVSVFAVYWLQPAVPIRRVDFILPTLTLGLAIVVWSLTRQAKFSKADAVAVILTGVIVAAVALTRYLIPALRPTPSRPPALVYVLAGMGVFALVWGAIDWMAGRTRGTPLRIRLVILGQVVIVAMFIILKTDVLAELASEWARGVTNQSTSLAKASDWQWLGFSYIAFRLIHMLRDVQAGRLPKDISLREHLTYVVFFPALTAGPIDRVERHIKDDRALVGMKGLDAPRITEGLTRIGVGILKKFVVADWLALIALDSHNAEQANSTGALWILLYAYALRLWLDFSGYSDIAIGLGVLFGIQLPENFDRPYLKNNLTAFWQSWHMSLSNWARYYMFNPVSRVLLRREPKPNPNAVVLTAHLSTMILIGLWHGVTVNFFVWGLWHGVGLFVHKMWSDRTRMVYMGLNERPMVKWAWSAAGWLVTFHFVVLGWVWFSLGDFGTAVEVLGRLVGR